MRFELNETEDKKLLALFNQHEKNIDYLLYLRDLIWQEPHLNSGLFANKNSFEAKQEFIKQVLENNKTDSSFINKNLLWDSQEVMLETFTNNPYYQALKNISFEEDGWKLETKKMKAYTLFPYDEQYHYGANSILKMSLGYFTKDYDYPTISLYDQEWMSLNPHEIRTMEMPIQIAKGKVLTLGLGLGYFAYMVHLKEEVKEVYIVEMDLELIKLFQKHLLPLFPYKEKIHIIKADALVYINQINDKDYDFIFSDLWHDVSDGLPMYIKLQERFNKFTYTKRHYWIENSLITYLRLLLIGVIKDEYYKNKNEYDEIQTTIKNNLENVVLHNSYELDALLSIQGVKSSVLIK